MMSKNVFDMPAGLVRIRLGKDRHMRGTNLEPGMLYPWLVIFELSIFSFFYLTPRVEGSGELQTLVFVSRGLHVFLITLNSIYLIRVSLFAPVGPFSF